MFKSKPAFTPIKYSTKGITVSRITILGMFLALMVVFKYALGFVPGIEIISFLFIIFALVLPLLDLTLLIISFNIMVVIMYGFAPWWLVYWVIWPIDAFGARVLKRFSNNRYVFALFGFLAGFSVAFWYFISDLFFFGYSMALGNIITALPINLIEGFATMLMVILVGPKLLHLIRHYSHSLWNKEVFTFKSSKHIKTGIVVTTLLSALSIGTIVGLFIKNDYFIKLRENFITQKDTTGYISNDHKGASGFDLLPTDIYNQFYDSIDSDQVGVAIIANGEYYTDIVDVGDNELLIEILRESKFTFKEIEHHLNGLGVWIATYKINGNDWLSGQSTSKNYGDYYPMYTNNHERSHLGVSNLKIIPRSIYEFTYDHTW